jgi:phage-related minor tail protein
VAAQHVSTALIVFTVAGTLVLSVAAIVGIRALAALAVKSWGDTYQESRNKQKEVDKEPTLHP